jgi:hypothetical protein
LSNQTQKTAHLRGEAWYAIERNTLRGDAWYEVERNTPRGEACYQSKLTEKDVRDIRLLASHGVSSAKLAPLFGISKNAVYSVIAGHSWKEVA